MRRRGAGTGLALTLLLTATLPASAGAAAAAPAPPATRCQITDPRLPEVSGLAEVGDRLLVHNDGGAGLEVFALDRACTVLDVRTGAVDPYDPEDLAVGADGTVWLADTGDNTGVRATVALLALRPDGSTAVYRLAYPDRPRDAEALLLAPDGTPYLVTKEVLGASAVFRPVSALVEEGTVGLAEVARVDLVLTGTPGGPVGRAGQLMVTGGAVSPDGRALALRTYTDAYVWPLSGSDVAGALAGEPRRVALPAAPQGEAVGFTGDSSALVVAGEGLPGDVTVVPLPPVPAPPGESPAADGLLAGPGDGGVPTAVAAAAAATAAGVLVWLGSRLLRRRG
ncbi:hypothetical protein SAMN06893096_110112 [Geodermatophilus pulveris]|uniref:Uncharacterized protein n=1 Tax=Geodermatophilus pulveris TaxID=1564159 RepID=A0A239IDH5_9ACTN|nr:hypothetical protein [Geodermatophilus pulveris]SNS91482.1 hypothetical protein SAMN06893096_110112 [Geodermatophilus pulveris]